VTDNFALREKLAFEIKRWRPAKTFTQARTDADTVIAALELPTPGVIPLLAHPLTKWVADNFVVHWDAASVALDVMLVGGNVMPDMVMLVGTNGSDLGYVKGSYGDVTPDQTITGNAIVQVRLSLSGNLVFRAASHDYAQDAFDTLEIVGQGVLPSASADFTLLATDSRWVWSGTLFNLIDGNYYLVEFN